MTSTNEKPPRPGRTARAGYKVSTPENYPLPCLCGARGVCLVCHRWHRLIRRIEARRADRRTNA